MRQAGSIVKKRNLYYIIYRKADKKQKWEGGFETKGKARTRLTEILRQMDTGTYVETTEETFLVFADKWLKSRVGIKDSTWQNYESYLNVHVKPVLGSAKLKDSDLPQSRISSRSSARKRQMAPSGYFPPTRSER